MFCTVRESSIAERRSLPGNLKALKIGSGTHKIYEIEIPLSAIEMSFARTPFSYLYSNLWMPFQQIAANAWS